MGRWVRALIESAAHLICHQPGTCLRDAVLHLPSTRQRSPPSSVSPTQRTAADYPHNYRGKYGAAQVPLVPSPVNIALRCLVSSSRAPKRVRGRASRVMGHTSPDLDKSLPRSLKSTMSRTALGRPFSGISDRLLSHLVQEATVIRFAAEGSSLVCRRGLGGGEV